MNQAQLLLFFFQTTIEDMISATVYLELCLRATIEPSLLRILIAFLIVERENDRKIIDILIDRIVYDSPRV